MWSFLSAKKNTKTVGLLTLLLVVAAIPLTLFLGRQEQNTKQLAAQVCSDNLATDTMLMIDKSGSMIQATSATDPTPRIEKAKDAAAGFVDRMEQHGINPPHFIGLTSISSDGKEKVESPLTSDYPAVKAALNAMTVSGGTCIECAAKLANDEFAQDTRADEKNVAIILTDGGATRFIGYDPNSSMTPAQRDAESEKRAMTEIMKGHTTYGTVYYTIGFGNDVKESFLKDVASRTGGKYYKVPTASDLDSVFQQISSLIGQGSISGKVFKDVNNNGTFESGDTRLSGWKLILRDPNGVTVQEATTNTNGEYIFTGICDGNFTIDQEVKPGAQQTLPSESSYSVTITNGEALKGMDFGNYIEAPSPTPYACTQFTPTDTMLVFDRSGSMTEPADETDTVSKLERAKTAALAFIDLLAGQAVTPKHQLGLTLFADQATTILAQALTTDYPKVKLPLATIETFPQTCIECALKNANDQINARGRTGTKKVVVLLSDGGATRYIGFTGEPDANTPALSDQKALAEALRGNDAYNITYYTIGFGDEIREQILKDIAASTGGKYYFAPNGDALEEVFEEISVQIGRGSIAGMKYHDKNYDGIKSDDESGLPDWTIQLRNSSNAVILTKQTDSEGKYIFTDLCNGTYSLTEVQKQGWSKTQPTGASQPVTITNGLAVENILFGNAEAKAIKLKLSLILDGIGVGGDTQNPKENVFSTKDPKRTTRDIKVEVRNDTTTLANTTGSITFNKETGEYTGEADVSTDIPAGSYFIRLRVDQYLSKKTPQKVQLNPFVDNTVPKLTLVAGDTNFDNKLDVLDYNQVLTCYTGLRGRPAACNDELHLKTDINDDGKVNEVDYNLLLREIPAGAGN